MIFFYSIKDSVLFNYANDNTLFYASQNIDDLKQIIKQDTTLAVNWLKNNGMQANPGKFQLLVSYNYETECVHEYIWY